MKLYYDGDDACGWYRVTITKETFAGFVVRFEDGSEITGVQEDELHPVVVADSPPWPDLYHASAAVDDAAEEEGGSDESLRNLISNIIRRKECCDYPGILNVTTKTAGKDIQNVYVHLLKAIHPAKCKLPGAAEAYELVKQAFMEIFQSS